MATAFGGIFPPRRYDLAAGPPMTLRAGRPPRRSIDEADDAARPLKAFANSTDDDEDETANKEKAATRAAEDDDDGTRLDIVAGDGLRRGSLVP
mmetsp:Transcript_54073/g.161865  ORF Transcript_54073/g.161865 Transcript_54073/m.161865 type:complete len:94 (-) Transcript_54073:274-555(-)